MSVLRPIVVAPVLALALLGASCSSSDSGDSADSAAPTALAVSSGGCETGPVVGEALLTPTTATAPQSASFANAVVAPQSIDCAGMTTFISTPQPGFDLQSYVFYGHLTDTNGTVIPFSTLSQTQPAPAGSGSPGAAGAPRTAAMTVNTGSGMTIGGLQGLSDTTIEVSATSNPFSLRTQTSTSGQAPQYVEARVVEGQLGHPGAVIELTAQVEAVMMGGASAGVTPMQVSVRLRDVAGVGQWGFGPSGFFPQWIEPDQRAAITGTYGGSVADYLTASNDPMTDQGSYYYSSPVVDVEAFTITLDGAVVASGTDGELIADYVSQSFDAAAAAVVDNGVQWTEFSTLLDGGRTLKVGQTEQSSVGTMPYAMMLTTDGARLANGALAASQRWNIGDITITADPGSTWTSPRSGKSYATKYTAELTGTDGEGSASFTYTAVIDDQEIDVAGRAVYEGLYAVSGSLDGQPISGYAWAEIQPTGTLG